MARLHARPLDLSKPQWEMYVIEGLDGVEGVPKGAFAMVLKIHHAAIDGMSGVEMTTAIHTQTPKAADPPPPAKAWSPEPDPSGLELLARAGFNAATIPARGIRVATKFVPGLGRAVGVQRRRQAISTSPAPITRFNGPVSAHRVVDGCYFRLDDVKKMRRAVEGATVNDVALAVLGGALRSYLEAAGELPDAPLRAMTPVSVRTESEKADLGNQVSAMIVSLSTDVADPVERLAAVTASTKASKELTQAIGARNLTEISQLAPGVLIGVGTRLAGRFARRMPGVINTVVTNVPGPARAPLLRRCRAGPLVRRRAGRRRHGADQHRVQLRRPVHADVHRRPGDDSRPGELCRLHPPVVRGPAGRQLNHQLSAVARSRQTAGSASGGRRGCRGRP